MKRLSNYAMDTFVGTNLSRFTEAEIPDMSEYDARSPLANYIGNAMLRARPPSPEFEYRFNYFRRLLTAFEEYNLARGQTLDFLAHRASGDAVEFGAYFNALHHWEQHLMATWHALKTMEAMVAGYRLFEPGAGSELERLNSLYNSAKHSESRIKHGQMPSQGPLAVWLSNVGIENTECAIEFTQLAETLTELATWAYVFEDPLSTRERLEGLIELEVAAQDST